MDLSHFYNQRSQNENYTLRQRQNLINRHGIKKFIAFDDRFLNVTFHLTRLVDQKFSHKKVKILDLGCGDGVYESLLSETSRRQAEFFGLDISRDQLQKAKDLFKETRVLDTDSQPVPYKDNFFDIAICSEVLEHVFYPEKIFAEIYRVLKPQGYFLITVPNFGALQIRLSTLFSGFSPLVNYSRNQEHLRFYSAADINKLYKDQNFVEETHHGLGSLYFDHWNFYAKVPFPRFLQVFFNRYLPNLATGLLYILRK